MWRELAKPEHVAFYLPVGALALVILATPFVYLLAKGRARHAPPRLLGVTLFAAVTFSLTGAIVTLVAVALLGEKGTLFDSIGEEAVAVLEKTKDAPDNVRIEAGTASPEAIKRTVFKLIGDVPKLEEQRDEARDAAKDARQTIEDEQRSWSDKKWELEVAKLKALDKASDSQREWEVAVERAESAAKALEEKERDLQWLRERDIPELIRERKELEEAYKTCSAQKKAPCVYRVMRCYEPVYIDRPATGVQPCDPCRPLCDPCGAVLPAPGAPVQTIVIDGGTTTYPSRDTSVPASLAVGGWRDARASANWETQIPTMHHVARSSRTAGRGRRRPLDTGGWRASSDSANSGSGALVSVSVAH